MALCLPAKFQVFIVIVNVLIVLYTSTGIMTLLPSLIFSGFFGYVWIIFLNCMCNNGYRWLSWLMIVLGLTTNILLWMLLYTMKKSGGKSGLDAMMSKASTAVGTAAPAAPDTAAAAAGATTASATPAAAGAGAAAGTPAGTAPAAGAPPLAAPVSTSVRTPPTPAATQSSLVK